MIRGNTSDFIDHTLPKDSVSAHGASHHTWTHHLNPALPMVEYKLTSWRDMRKATSTRFTNSCNVFLELIFYNIYQFVHDVQSLR